MENTEEVVDKVVALLAEIVRKELESEVRKK